MHGRGLHHQYRRSRHIRKPAAPPPRRWLPALCKPIRRTSVRLSRNSYNVRITRDLGGGVMFKTGLEDLVDKVAMVAGAPTAIHPEALHPQYAARVARRQV